MPVSSTPTEQGVEENAVPVGYSLIVPAEWARIPLREDPGRAVREILVAGDADLVVDQLLLDESTSELGMLRGQFEGLSGWKDELAGILGHSEVEGAMNSFVDNWKKNRERLLGRLEEVGKAVEGCRDAFGELETGLRQQLQGEG